MEQEKKNHDFEFLMKLYDESQIQRRHHETYRSALTGLVVTLYVALFSCLRDGNIGVMYILYLLMALSVFGILGTISYTERYNFYWKRSQVLRAELAKCAEVDVDEIYENALNYKPQRCREYRWPQAVPNCFRHHKLWMIFHVLVLLFSMYALMNVAVKDRCDQSPIVNNVTINPDGAAKGVVIDTVEIQ